MPLCVTRRTFFAAPAVLARAAGQVGTMRLLTKVEAGRMQDMVRRDRGGRIERYAKAALAAGPWSVTFKRPKGIETDAAPNDYVSEAPYWFPNPGNPAGPYVRRDGERNEDRFVGNANDLRAMASAVLSLGMGAFFLGDADCVRHAAKVLSVWFLDSSTRMNPHLEHGQLVRGINTGRGAGIIDTQCLIHAAHGIELLESAGGLPLEISTGLRAWFAEYAKWMTTSAHGSSESRAGNNHATWWTAQVAAYAFFTGNAGLRRTAWSHFREYLVPSEIQPDGSCPREEARTRSLHYSSMNLDAFALLCRMAALDGEGLWHYRTPAGVGVARAFLYLLPYLRNPGAWNKQQIDRYDPGAYYFAGLAGVGLPSESLLSAYRDTARPNGAWGQFLNLLIRSSV